MLDIPLFLNYLNSAVCYVLHIMFRLDEQLDHVLLMYELLW